LNLFGFWTLEMKIQIPKSKNQTNSK